MTHLLRIHWPSTSTDTELPMHLERFKSQPSICFQSSSPLFSGTGKFTQYLFLAPIAFLETSEGGDFFQNRGEITMVLTSLLCNLTFKNGHYSKG